MSSVLSGLSQEELDLLKKLGITESSLRPKEERASKDTLKAPKMIVLDSFSGEVISHCLCCGNTDKHFVDYVKRADCEGYCLKRVEVPTCAVTREHLSDVLSCSKCADDQLEKLSAQQLKGMIVKLRKYIRKEKRV
jgi:hypothetical protein